MNKTTMIGGLIAALLVTGAIVGVPVVVKNDIQQETRKVNTFFDNICGNTGQATTSGALNTDGFGTMVLFIETNKTGAEKPDFRVQASFDGDRWLTQRDSNDAFFLFPVPIPVVAPLYRVQLQANATNTCVTVHEYLTPFFVQTGV